MDANSNRKERRGWMLCYQGWYLSTFQCKRMKKGDGAVMCSLVLGGREEERVERKANDGSRAKGLGSCRIDLRKEQVMPKTHLKEVSY